MTTIWNAGWLSPITGGESGIISHHRTRTGAADAIVAHAARRMRHAETPLDDNERTALMRHLANHLRLPLFWRMSGRNEPIEGMSAERRQEIGDQLDEIYTLSEAPLED